MGPPAPPRSAVENRYVGGAGRCLSQMPGSPSQRGRESLVRSPGRQATPWEKGGGRGEGLWSHRGRAGPDGFGVALGTEVLAGPAERGGPATGSERALLLVVRRLGCDGPHGDMGHQQGREGGRRLEAQLSR